MWNVRGLNKRDHQLAVKDLVSEHRLHFMGILETRVQYNNIMHIQSFLLPHWKWFVDYVSVGNRIWVTWDDNVVDVHILELGNEFVHRRVSNRADSESLTITVVYGASEMIDRRSLWNTLETLSREQRDDPWLVGGDFNAVREMNEVCGVSGDIRTTMEEFNAAIQEAGLIPLPMQGECVQNIWQHSIIGVPMFAVTRKLKALKPVFREQRRKKGDLTLNVQLAKGFLDEAQQLVRNDRQNEALLQLEHCCRLVYAKARRVAIMEQINDDYGTSHTEPGEIINEFVHCYQNPLGGNRRQILIDIGFLRPWARHILSNEEASHLISTFTPDDVKQAVFDIAEDKAPGPDGYSSGFFKAAWPVVGQEVTKAVLDFFRTGKLLKQVNSTSLALIPKELFTGYNQMRLPPRCALKVDIRKAYDTVEWDFLLAVLQLFGFPQTFTKWIEEICNSFTIGNVSRPKYSSWDSLMTSCFSVELTWTLSESSRWDWIDLQNGLDFG
ncbi:uncharacterized protein LOC105178996 [Sesamum indicum]|uniref:Uncharacterized protein LOC105178996 n=1 Tax=Sesamum indicum TaxID=4182 RepID=A0A6I9UQE2_SESIN|nr:uncharacterized protein LOC105178996 [Sesamum indicum]